MRVQLRTLVTNRMGFESYQDNAGGRNDGPERNKENGINWNILEPVKVKTKVRKPVTRIGSGMNWRLRAAPQKK